MTASVVVTGASGFLGRRLVARLAREAWDVRPMSRRAGHGPGSLPYPEDGAFAAEPLRGTEAIVHAAAYVPPRGDDEAYAEECLRINAVHTLRLLRAAAGAGVRRFVYISAGNAYALGATPRRECDPLYPDAHGAYYLHSKLAGELYVSAFQRAGAIATVVLRPSSIYGPGMPEQAMVARFLDQARRGHALELSHGGGFGADLVYVDDVVEAVVRALATRASGIFNVGSGQRTTALEAARAALRAAGADESRLRVTGSATPMHGFCALDSTLARDVLGLVPTPLAEGIRRWLEEEATGNIDGTKPVL